MNPSVISIICTMMRAEADALGGAEALSGAETAALSARIVLWSERCRGQAPVAGRNIDATAQRLSQWAHMGRAELAEISAWLRRQASLIEHETAQMEAA